MAEGFVVVRYLGKLPKATEADRAIRAESPLGPTSALGRSPAERGFTAKGLTAKSLTAKGARGRAEPPEIRLSVEKVDRKDAEDARRDRRTVGIAPVMPTKLIYPTAHEGSVEDPKGATWGIEAVGALASKRTGVGVKVAVLDTGIDRGHAAFKGIALEEMDFTETGNGDRQGHGTHCAATIFGRSVDGIRIGVAPGVESAAIGKVLRDDGTGDTLMLFKALNWILHNVEGVDVVSMSLGFDFPGYVERMVKAGWPVDLATSVALVTYRDTLRAFDAIMAQIGALAPFNEGMVVVAASGNESRVDADHPDHRIAVSLPAAADGLISVGALERKGRKFAVAPFSNTRARVSAPGVGVRSAEAGTKKSLVAKDGTSMACPHVAGIAALWWEEVRTAGEKEANARAVEIELLASVRSDVFASGVEPLDRGDGLVTAP